MDRYQKLALAGFVAIGIPGVLGYLGPYFGIFDLFAHFRMQYAVLSIPLVVLFFFRRQFLIGSCFAIIMGMNLQTVLPYINFNTLSAGDNDLTILTYNVRWSNAKTNEILQIVNQANADVTILQEPNAELLQAIDATSTWSQNSMINLRSNPYSIAIFSRLPLAGDLKWSKNAPFISAQLNLSSKKINIAAVHAPLPWHYKLRAKYLESVLESIDDEDIPGIIAGDLNLTPYSPEFDRLLKLGRLSDSRLGRGLNPTWPSAFAFDFFRIPIDHVLISSHFTVSSLQTLDAAGSDHKPLLVSLALTPPMARHPQ